MFAEYILDPAMRAALINLCDILIEKLRHGEIDQARGIALAIAKTYDAVRFEDSYGVGRGVYRQIIITIDSEAYAVEASQPLTEGRLVGIANEIAETIPAAGVAGIETR